MHNNEKGPRSCDPNLSAWVSNYTQGHIVSSSVQCTHFERDAVLCGRLVLLAPVNAEVDVYFTERLDARHISLTTLLACCCTCATCRRRAATKSARPQHAVELLPRLLVVGLDVQRSLHVVHRVNQHALHASHACKEYLFATM